VNRFPEYAMTCPDLPLTCGSVRAVALFTRTIRPNSSAWWHERNAAGRTADERSTVCPPTRRNTTPRPIDRPGCPARPRLSCRTKPPWPILAWWDPQI